MGELIMSKSTNKIGIFVLLVAAALFVQPLNLFAVYSNDYEIEYETELIYEANDASVDEEENTPIDIAAERSPGEYIDVLISVAQKGSTGFKELQIYLDYDPNVLVFDGVSPIIMRDLLTETQQAIYDHIGSEAFGETFPRLMGSNNSCLNLTLDYYESALGRISITWTTNGDYENSSLSKALFVIVRYTILDDAPYGITRITPNHLAPVFIDITLDEINIRKQEECPLFKRPVSQNQEEAIPVEDEQFRDWYLFGHRDGTIRPHGRMTRAEVFQVFFNISDDPLKYQNYGESAFVDVDSSAWYFDAVSFFERTGKVSGFRDGTFRPYQLMTKAEFIFFAIRFFDIDVVPNEELVQETHWAATYINSGFGGGWLDYFGIANNFNPNAPITRAQSVALINFYLGRTPNVDAIRNYLDGDIVWPDLQVGHWSFYEIIEASIARSYSFDEDGNEFWIETANTEEITGRISRP